MKIDLLKFLAENEIHHPTRVERLNLHSSSASLHLIGRGWWLDEPGDREDVRIEFRFDRIEDARISEEWFLSDDYNEALENFSVERMHEQEWAVGNAVSIYCSEPLKDPLSVYSILEEHLAHSGCPNRIENYLHMSHTLKSFVEFVQARCYLLFEGNSSLSRPVLRELERQGVKHSVVEHNNDEDSRLYVVWGCGYLICRSAYAICDV